MSPVQPLRPGDAAPPFSLRAHDGRLLSLTDFRGRKRVIVAFYPADDTASGRHELNGFAGRRAEFEAASTQIIGISASPSEAQARFAAKLQLPFPLLSDPKGEVARMYGARGLVPLFLRRTFVIDGRGVLRLAMRGQPDMTQLLEFLAALHGDVPGA